MKELFAKIVVWITVVAGASWVCWLVFLLAGFAEEGMAKESRIYLHTFKWLMVVMVIYCAGWLAERVIVFVRGKTK